MVADVTRERASALLRDPEGNRRVATTRILPARNAARSCGNAFKRAKNRYTAKGILAIQVGRAHVRIRATWRSKGKLINCSFRARRPRPFSRRRVPMCRR